MITPKALRGDSLSFIICTFHFTGLIQVDIVISVEMWEFDTPVFLCIDNMSGTSLVVVDPVFTLVSDVILDKFFWSVNKVVQVVVVDNQET